MINEPEENEDLDAEMASRASSPVIPSTAMVVPPDLNKPIPTPEEKVVLPICRVCQGELDQIRTIDYGHLSVVIHTRNRCVVGVLYAKEKEE